MLPPGEVVEDQAERPEELLEDQGEDPDKLPKEEPVYESESEEEPVYAPAPPPILLPEPVYPERPRPPMPPYPMPQSDEGPVYPPLEPIQPVLVYTPDSEGIDVPAQPLAMRPGNYIHNDYFNKLLIHCCRISIQGYWWFTTERICWGSKFMVLRLIILICNTCISYKTFSSGDGNYPFPTLQ